ncbi:uncharacterized protein BDZ83DRAFT_12270 [Colletotrichum acutatum]|uniref:Uncharacterized protein n=1 Tax=Glomerella acutata TaxID=27357 RepID=A0AAD8XLI5_GLOAC|nr:uncharacterized protein BDZ83DRAFT_12270 [Colletotrichum acutatum]KAK1729613.1 hypothetical protein BDZ83DRAFT_12270 [Colletotrichum acutatum]
MARWWPPPPARHRSQPSWTASTCLPAAGACDRAHALCFSRSATHRWPPQSVKFVVGVRISLGSRSRPKSHDGRRPTSSDFALAALHNSRTDMHVYGIFSGSRAASQGAAWQSWESGARQIDQMQQNGNSFGELILRFDEGDWPTRFHHRLERGLKCIPLPLHFPSHCISPTPVRRLRHDQPLLPRGKENVRGISHQVSALLPAKADKEAGARCTHPLRGSPKLWRYRFTSEVNQGREYAGLWLTGSSLPLQHAALQSKCGFATAKICLESVAGRPAWR